MSQQPTITLYTGQTPNGIKISITLEELGIPYTTYHMKIPDNEHKTVWFTKINPNGRIPAITDTLPDGKEIRVFDSGSIMQYLVDRYDKDHKISYERGTAEWIETNSWLFFLQSGVGPMQGQANHFFRYCTEDIPYAIDRYQTEVRRLYGVLDKHFIDAGSQYLVGDKCTIADIALWPWVTLARWSLGGDPPASPLQEFPALKAWEERMFLRENVEKGRQVPDKHQRELLQDAEAMKAFEQKGRAFYQKLAEEKSEEKK